MSELDSIEATTNQLELGGKMRTLRFRFKAWAALERKYGDIQKIYDELKSKPFENLPIILEAGIVRDGDEVITLDNVIDWLDEYELNDFMEIAKIASGAMNNSVPEAKKGTPRRAKPE